MVTVAELRVALVHARKGRDKVAEAALKRAITALEDAAAPPAGTGDGATEIARLDLSPDERRVVLEKEVAEWLCAADQYEAAGQSEAAARLRAECDVLTRLLD